MNVYLWWFETKSNLLNIALRKDNSCPKNTNNKNQIGITCSSTKRADKKGLTVGNQRIVNSKIINYRKSA